MYSTNRNIANIAVCQFPKFSKLTDIEQNKQSLLQKIIINSKKHILYFYLVNNTYVI